MNDPKRKSTEHSRTHNDYVIGCISKIAAAANVELSVATMTVYLEHLTSLSRHRIAQATERTIDEWTEPSKMPPIPFIVERSYLPRESHEVVNDAPRILNRPALTGEVETREARQEYSRRLIEEMRAKLGANSMPAAEMPDDPEKRRKWASERARKQGWL